MGPASAGRARCVRVQRPNATENASARRAHTRAGPRASPLALATSRRNLGDEGVVVTGTLTAAGQTVRGVRLRWWMGD